MINELLKSLYFYILPTFYLFYGLKLLHKRFSLSAVFLGLYFVTFSVRSLSSFFLSEKISPCYIHFHRIQSPLHYLIPVFAYAFTYFAFKPTKKLTIGWYLLFIPFLLHFIEYLPFYFSSSEFKFKDLALANQSGSLIDYPSLAGFIPVKVHTMFKYIYTLILLIFGLRIFFVYFKSYKSFFFKNNFLLLNWLGIDLLIKVFSFIFVIFYGLGYFKFTGYEFKPSDFFMFLDVTFNAFFILLNPKLLAGAIFDFYPKEFLASSNDKSAAVSNPHDKIWHYLNFIMEVESPFLEEKFSIKTLSDRLKISERQISTIIKSMSNMSYPDFVATWRLKYILKMRKEDENWKQYSIEKISEKSGFGSRQSMYNSIHRLHQMTPQKFFEQNEEGLKE